MTTLNPLDRLTCQFLDVSARSEAATPLPPRLSVYRRTAISDLESYVYEPVLCLILQGAKSVAVGEAHAVVDAGDALLVSHDVPVRSRIERASASAPYVALILRIDLTLARTLSTEIADAAPSIARDGPLAVARADDAVLEPVARYAALAPDPLDARVLGPSVLREIHYRLALSPIGGTLRRLLDLDSSASRVGRAIARLRSEFRTELRVADLADAAGMSPSSFHDHFKSATGTTPLQYQKDLRLIEAHALIVAQRASVAAAAYAVGYESPTHFSRDFRRKFGAAPSRTARAVAAE